MSGGATTTRCSWQATLSRSRPASRAASGTPATRRRASSCATPIQAAPRPPDRRSLLRPREMAQPATVRGVVDERGEPLAARVLALGADDPVGRGPLVAGRLRLEEAPRRCVCAELALMAGLELCLFPLLVGVDAGAV